MEENATVQCPYCGQSFELAVDISIRTQRFMTECEICCHPLEIYAECEAGEVVRLEVQ